MPQLTSNQIDKLKSLGIKVHDTPSSVLPKKKFNKDYNHNRPTLTPTANSFSQINNLDLLDKNSRNSNLITKPSHSNVFPILSISGLTLLSFSGLILFKSKGQTTTPATISNTTLPETSISPTQVPKSIQHYLLTSQQHFTQASQNQSVDSLNQAIIAATNAIKEFPNDYRGFYQRGRIYQSVLSSKPELVSQVIADFTQAQKLEPNNGEITHSLASAYATKGDAQNTINYLSKTIAIEPTKAQNFYDLARIQQQVGLLPQAIQTYSQLLTLISDPNQKNQVELEKTSLEQLLAQTPNQKLTQTDQNSSATPIDLPVSLDSPAIQAAINGGLIVAAPEEIDQVKVSNLTTSNSFSGNNTLVANNKEVTISNSQVTSASQVYVSVTRGGKNQNLQVISKTSGSFTAGLDNPISEDIEFKWWIIN